jgi:hypothetical protein
MQAGRYPRLLLVELPPLMLALTKWRSMLEKALPVPLMLLLRKLPVPLMLLLHKLPLKMLVLIGQRWRLSTALTQLQQ